MTIQEITKDNLPKLELLLSASYGEPINIQDELDYFPRQTVYWYAAFQGTTPVGFIRHFRIGASTDHQLELYTTHHKIKHSLLLYFLAQIKNSAISSVRLYLNEQESSFAAFLTSLNFEQQATYLTLFSAYPSNLAFFTEAYVRFAKSNTEEINAIQSILQEHFGSSSTDRIAQQIREGLVTVVECKKGKIIGVCHYSAHQKEKEIIQIAVNTDHQNQGYGKTLLSHTISLLLKKELGLTFFLRVKAQNHIAIK